MTEFVESFTTRNMLPPWNTEAARSWLFVAPIDQDRTQTYLDHFMNSLGPDLAPYHYEVWSDPCFGFLTLVDHDCFSSETSAMGDGSYLSHREMIWTFPAARYRRTENNLLVEKTLVWIQPFYFDSNSFVTFSSREIWGGEKGMADIKIADGSTARDFHMDVALNGFATYNPRSHVHAIGGVHIRGGPLVPDEILPGDAIHRKQTGKKKRKSKKARTKLEGIDSVATAGTGDSADGPPIPPLDRVIKADKELLAFLASFQQLMHKDWNADNPTHNFFVPDIRINSLKQYRDAFSIERAAYRAIVESAVSHDNVVDYGYLPRERIDVRFMWSDSFKEQLKMLFNLEEPGKDTAWGHVGQGLRIDDTGIDWNLPAVRLDVRLALYFQSDARFEVEKVLYTYGEGPHYPQPERQD